ncbi:propionaldehyde reductase [Natranaerovirga hydrolytica]|uniref:Propionaldehyde reductase n=1 Tax=Natranaerovirga hydrolytica TaxID=680378 RepID=A0A4R1M6W8_9FIRM|nr:1-propanol dehydrogenase PduQ [Natranaerovirga hydrolytica]TCK88026.1 propionaldehyde reductase [Natranaerovirga hydrolytica]
MKPIYIKTKIYQGTNALKRLESIQNKKIWIICDQFLVQNGNIEEVKNTLKGNNEVIIFSDVVPDPPLRVIQKGIIEIKKIKPDVIIGYGGGSAIDTAKGILYFAKKAKWTQDVKFIAIPTTSGTGSEVTSFTIVTDTQEKIKHTIVDDDLLPDETILDAKLTTTVPPKITANTGIDVLTHALEAYVSKNANAYSDALAEKAIELVLESLLKCYKNGKDEKARDLMHQASNLAGIAFNIAGLGIGHSIAHQLGGVFHVPHGLANAMVLNQVIEFNAKEEKAFNKYVDLAYKLGLVEHKDNKEFAMAVLLEVITSMKKIMDMPLTLKAYGINEDDIQTHKETMAENAIKDLCTTTNPRHATQGDILNIIEKL